MGCHCWGARELGCSYRTGWPFPCMLKPPPTCTREPRMRPSVRSVFCRHGQRECMQYCQRVVDATTSEDEEPGHQGPSRLNMKLLNALVKCMPIGKKSLTSTQAGGSSSPLSAVTATSHRVAPISLTTFPLSVMPCKCVIGWKSQMRTAGERNVPSVAHNAWTEATICMMAHSQPPQLTLVNQQTRLCELQACIEASIHLSSFLLAIKCSMRLCGACTSQ